MHEINKQINPDVTKQPISRFETANRYEKLAGYEQQTTNYHTFQNAKPGLAMSKKTQSTCILGDSTINMVKPKFIKMNIGKNEKEFVKSFTRANVKQVYQYSIPSANPSYRYT